jgi:hypothetical protein
MLKKLKLYHELSHDTNTLAFYEQYLDQLRVWCEHYGIESTAESIRMERLIEEEIVYLKYPNTSIV